MSPSRRVRLVSSFAVAVAACSVPHGDDGPPEPRTRAIAQALANGVPDSMNVISGAVRLNGCSGALIAPDLVLTAAHCLDANTQTPPAAHTFQLNPSETVGFDDAHVLAGFKSPPAQTVALSLGSNAFVSPMFAAGVNGIPQFDLAVVKLAKPVAKAFAEPLCVATVNPVKGGLQAQFQPDPACVPYATDPTECNWYQLPAFIAAYGQTSPGVGLPSPSVPMVGPLQVYGLSPYAPNPSNIDYDDAGIQVLFDSTGGTFPVTMPGDSGAPWFVGKSIVLDYDSQSDPLFTGPVYSIIAVNSQGTGLSNTGTSIAGARKPNPLFRGSRRRGSGHNA